MVVARVGNGVDPTASDPIVITPAALPGGQPAADFWWRCVPPGENINVPVIIGSPNPELGPVAMNELLAPTLAAAADQGPGFELVAITGFRLRSDGTIDLGARDDYVARWVFSFHDPATDATFSLAWLTAAAGATNPVLLTTGTENTTPPLPLVSLPDSPAVVAAMSETEACPAPQGRSEDTIVYGDSGDGPAVTVILEEGTFWRAPLDTLEPFENSQCE